MSVEDGDMQDVELGEVDGLIDQGAKGEAASGPAKPVKPEFNFWKLGWEVNLMVFGILGFWPFFVKWLCLQILRLAGNLGFVVLAYVVKDIDPATLSTTEYIIFSAIGILTIVGRLIPMGTQLLVSDLKVQLQVAQGTAVVAKLFEMEHNAVLSTPTGEFAQLLSKVYMNMDRLLPAWYGNVLPVILEGCVATIVIGIFYGWIALGQMVLLIAFSLAAYQAAMGKARRNRELMAAMFSEWAKLLDTANSYERAHFFDSVDFEVDKSRKAFTHMGSNMTNVEKGEHRSKCWLTGMSLIINGAFAMLVFVTADKNSTILEVAALVFYYFMYLTQLEMYAVDISLLRSALEELQGLNTFINRKSGVTDKPDAIDLEPTQNPTIEFKNVTFSYAGKVILNNISFLVEGGSTLGLVGSSGCGKSTIMRLLLRFYRQSSGSIHVDGHDITEVTGRSLRRLFSVVTQDAQLFNSTIRDNINYGKRGSSDDDILKAAALAELQFDELDMTLDKIVGEKGAKLSGGQQQRVSIARAMLKNGTIYLLDEPTTGLDGIVAKQLQKTLDDLATNATTIMVTHHLEDLRKADQILYLDNGSITERGTYEELCAKKGVFFQQTRARQDSEPGLEDEGVEGLVHVEDAANGHEDAANGDASAAANGDASDAANADASHGQKEDARNGQEEEAAGQE